MAAPNRIDIRDEPETVARVDLLAEQLSQPGHKVSRADVARMALRRGLDAMEAEQKGGTKRPRKG